MKKILIIEDNELNLKLFYDILTFKNYAVDKATDGMSGLEKILNNAYDLIILDLQLPKLNGFEIIERLKKEKARLPKIVIVSACAMDSDKQKALSCGIKSYITKPVDIHNFVSVIENEIN